MALKCSLIVPAFLQPRLDKCTMNSSSSSSSSLLLVSEISRRGLIPRARQKKDHHRHPTLYDLMVELANLSSMSSSLAFSQSSCVLRSVRIVP